LKEFFFFIENTKFSKDELVSTLRILRGEKIYRYSPKIIRAEALEILLAQIVIQKTRLKISELYAVPNKGKGLKSREILRFLKEQRHVRGKLMGFGIGIDIMDNYGTEYLLKNAIGYLESEIELSG